MADKDYVIRLENVIKQTLTPLRNIPFNLVIESMSGKMYLRKLGTIFLDEG